MAWVFGLLAVNDDVTAFHYIFAVSCLLQGLFVILAHVLLNKRVRISSDKLIREGYL